MIDRSGIEVIRQVGKARVHSRMFFAPTIYRKGTALSDVAPQSCGRGGVKSSLQSLMGSLLSVGRILQVGIGDSDQALLEVLTIKSSLET